MLNINKQLAPTNEKTHDANHESRGSRSLSHQKHFRIHIYFVVYSTKTATFFFLFSFISSIEILPFLFDSENFASFLRLRLFFQFVQRRLAS